MFETLRKPGSFRIDYLNSNARGLHDAFAFYVRGELVDDAPYSLAAKHHLCAGLSVIRKNMNCDRLVAIYVDINPAYNLYRPAYVQMKHDLRAGYFRRIFTFQSGDLLGDWSAEKDLKKLYQDINGFDVLSYQGEKLQHDPILEKWLSQVEEQH
jgi:hypothetical protein